MNESRLFSELSALYTELWRILEDISGRPNRLLVEQLPNVRLRWRAVSNRLNRLSSFLEQAQWPIETNLCAQPVASRP